MDSIGLGLWLIACGGDSGSSTNQNVQGTVTLPADATGKCYIIALDTDEDGGNGFTAFEIGEATGTTIPYKINNDSDGTFFIWAIVDVDQDNSATGACAVSDIGPPNSGDYLGYYGGAGIDPPGAANVNIPDDTSLDFDFTLGTLPPV